MKQQVRSLRRFAFVLVALFALAVPAVVAQAGGSSPFVYHLSIHAFNVPGSTVNPQVTPANCEVADANVSVLTHLRLAGVRVFLTDADGTFEAETETLVLNGGVSASLVSEGYAHTTQVRALGLAPAHTYSFRIAIIAEDGQFTYNYGTLTTPQVDRGDTATCYATQREG